MKRKKLYTESPYALERDLDEDLDEDLEELEEEVEEEETMRSHHVVLICITVLASVFLLLYYQQQDRFIVSTQNGFVAIFDRKHRSLNICSNTDCRMMMPTFELPSDKSSQGILPAFANQFMPNLMPQPQQAAFPPQQQMMQPPPQVPQMPMQQAGFPQQPPQPMDGGQTAVPPPAPAQ